MPEDPRFLTAVSWLFMKAQIMYPTADRLPTDCWASLERHDAAQRELLATLEEEVKYLRSARILSDAEIDELLNPIRLRYSVTASAIDRTFTGLRSQVATLEADNRRLREALDQFPHDSMCRMGSCRRCGYLERNCREEYSNTHTFTPRECDCERSRVLAVALQPATTQPSGNTGEFKCATCRDTKQVPFVYGQEYDCVMSTTKPCPDCSAAQPATEQPRIWRVRNAQGILYGTGTCDEAEARKWAAELALQTLAYSTDKGETWVDEQAGQEGTDKLMESN